MTLTVTATAPVIAPTQIRAAAHSESDGGYAMPSYVSHAAAAPAAALETPEALAEASQRAATPADTPPLASSTLAAVLQEQERLSRPGAARHGARTLDRRAYAVRRAA